MVGVGATFSPPLHLPVVDWALGPLDTWAFADVGGGGAHGEDIV